MFHATHLVRPNRFSARALSKAIFGLLCLISTTPAHTADFLVTRASDGIDAAPGDGRCETTAGSGACTLRAAIQESNALAGGDTITLPANVYELTLAGANENASFTGDLDITGTGDLTLTGAGRNVTIIDGGRLDRVFHLTGEGAVVISGITIQNGDSSTSAGGGINNQSAALTLRDSAVINNASSTTPQDFRGGGGGVYNGPNAYMTMENTEVGRAGAINRVSPCLNFTIGSVSDCTRGVIGGAGVYNAGTMTIKKGSSINHNIGGPFGAGILNTGTLTISDTILNSNKGSVIDSGGSNLAISDGGAIYTAGGSLVIKRSIISNNSAVLGGGIHHAVGFDEAGFAKHGSLYIVSSRIHTNSADQYGGGLLNSDKAIILYSTFDRNGARLGGAIASFGASADMTLENSTIAQNSATTLGGGIHTGGELRVTHSTIYNNGAADGASLYQRTTDTNPAHTTLRNTLIATDANDLSCTGGTGQVDTGGGGTDVLPNEDPVYRNFITSLGGNIEFNSSTGLPNAGNSCNLNTTKGDRTQTDPLLGSLDGGEQLPGGGYLPMYAPQTGSPAIDLAMCVSPLVDQQLHTRPETSGGKCDSGSVETGSSPAALADVDIEVKSNPTLSVDVGQHITYYISITNDGPQATSGLTSLVAAVSQNTQPVGWTYALPEGVTDGVVRCDATETTVSCRYETQDGAPKSLAVGDTLFVRVIAKPIVRNLAGPDVSTNTVTIASAAPVDHVPFNNSVTKNIEILPTENPVDQDFATGTAAAPFGLLLIGAAAAALRFEERRRRQKSAG